MKWTLKLFKTYHIHFTNLKGNKDFSSSFFLKFSIFFRPFSIIEKNDGMAPLTYHQFQLIVAELDLPRKAEPPVNLDNLESAVSPIDYDHDEKYGVPSLCELGIFFK